MARVAQNTWAAGRALAAACALLLATCAPALAASEDGDAGALPATAHEPLGTGALDSITGTIAGRPDEDVYKVCLTGGGTFSATVTSTTIDSQLYLFDSVGRGVYGNDDRSSTVVQSTLPSGHALTPSAPGVYYLAISTFNSDPLSAGGPIFPNNPFTAVHGPTGPGGASPISGWTHANFDTGPYTLSMTGARFCTQPDTSAPQIELLTPADGASYLLGEQVLADYSCFDENGGSGLASCAGTVADGAPLDTAAVGDKSLEVVATDNAGNRASVSHGYRVVFGFEGFSKPVANRPAVNVAKAGSSVPIKFGLSGDHGLDVFALGHPRSVAIPCGSSADVDGGQPTATPGSSRLGYSADADRYQYVWQTDKSWGGSCRQLVLKLIDGTSHRAQFSFR